MPFIPFAATVGAAIGATGSAAAIATAGGMAIAGGVATAAAIGTTVANTQAQAKASKQAASQQQAQTNTSIADLNQAKDAASTVAQASLATKQRLRAGSQTIFTSPLGISGQATTAKKTLLGQ